MKIKTMKGLCAASLAAMLVAQNFMPIATVLAGCGQADNKVVENTDTVEIKVSEDNELSETLEDIVEELFVLLNTQFHNGVFTNLHFTGSSGYGDEVTQNPLWIRPDSLMKSAVCGVNQVVGHTEVPDEKRIRMHGTDKVIFLDSEAEMRNVYAEIDTDSGIVEIKKLNNVWDYW